ncbi:MAG: M23 family metallopeptidase, partial [Chloroflexota bacterium]
MSEARFLTVFRSLCFATLLWLCSFGLVRADVAPPPATAIPVNNQVIPAQTPIPVTSPVVPEATVIPPISDSSPVVIQRERSTPVTSESQPVLTPEGTGPQISSTSTAQTEGQRPTSPALATRNRNATSSAPSSTSTSTSGTAPTTAPNVSSQTSGASSTPVGTTLIPGTSQAPAQLTCTAKRYPVSAPFLVAPYAGWTEVVSFVDHDSPDYSVDGTIVLANGLTATSGNGQASDVFPSYWSPSLRQYVNYDGHNGYDLGLSYQPVLAAGDGTVQYAGWNSPDPYAGYGQMVLINHHNGYVTLYGHLSSLGVKTGDKVHAGQEIGVSGTTGNSSGPHLHFSVFHNCQVTDPYGWTGSGKDPLTDFNGEHASYLWLPGHDPLLLNPPPDWPSYPAGLAVALPLGGTSAGVAPRVAPVTDRLLLLALPTPQTGAGASPAVALARTEARVSQEAESLTPQLDELQSQGLIRAYQVVPAAAAIWVRGTASSSQLESLDGVASLTGVQPSDVLAAQAGVSHAVLIQIGQQQAPSLWPVGFHSGLHAWRPVTTVLNGSSMVAGFALPGKSVFVSLHRAGAVVGTAGAVSDPANGGFVAMLHRTDGSQLIIRDGDSVEFDSSGRISRVLVRPMKLRARATRVTGLAPAGTTLTITTVNQSGATHDQLGTANRHGVFAHRLSGSQRNGTLGVAAFTDAAGDEEGISAFVPGLNITEGSSIVQGWTVAYHPLLTIVRNRTTLDEVALRPAADGAFVVSLLRNGQPLVLRPHDVLIIGSRSHHRSVRLPDLSVRLGLLSSSMSIHGPARATLGVGIEQSTKRLWSSKSMLSQSGVASIRLPFGPARVGDSATVTYTSPGG